MMAARSRIEAPMTRLRIAAPAFALLAGCAAAPDVARAPAATAQGEIKVLSAVVMRPVLGDIVAGFERETGYKVAMDFATAGVLRDRIRNGEAADVTILTRPTMDTLVREAKIVPGSDVVVGRGNVGV